MKEIDYINQRKLRNPSKLTLFVRKLKTFSWKKIAITIIVAILLIAGAIYITRSNILTIDSISVTSIDSSDLRYLNVAEIEDQVAWLNSNNYFTVDLSRAEKEIIDQFPFVKKVVISKDFPNKVKILIVERKPVFVINVNNQQCYLAEADGHVLNYDLNITECSTYTKQYNSIYTDIVNPLNPYVKGQQSNSYVILKLSQLVDNLSSKNYTVDRIVVKDQYCELTLLNKKILVFAIDDSLNEQIARFEIILPELEKNDDQYRVLDLRYDRPIKRY